MSYTLKIFLWTSYLIWGADFVLIESQLAFTFDSQSIRTIAEFQVPSQIICVHRCRHLSSKMFYGGDDLCICFEEIQEKKKYEKDSNSNIWILQGILMVPLKMEKIKVNRVVVVLRIDTNRERCLVLIL